jgi:ribonuclease HII
MLSRFKSDKIVCGVDEAGRGCLAGPVVAAAVILPSKFRNKTLNDSKQLTEKQRDKLRLIIEREAIAYGVGIIDNHKIDAVNILQATFLAMHSAIQNLAVQPELLLIDGNRFRPYPAIQHHCIIAGDAIYMEIAAASVLAKTYRDEIMHRLHDEFPHYTWKDNKGYATPEHRVAIAEHGPCNYHRVSFRLLKPEQLELL